MDPMQPLLRPVPPDEFRVNLLWNTEAGKTVTHIDMYVERINPNDVPLAYICNYCVEVVPAAEWTTLTKSVPFATISRCSQGHIPTMPDELVLRERLRPERMVTLWPPTRRVIELGTLTAPGALELLAAAQGVVDGTLPMSALADAIDRAPTAIQAVKPKRMTRSEWLHVAEILIVLLVGLLPLILADGPADNQTIVVQLDEQMRQHEGVDGQDASGDETDSGEETVPRRTGRPVRPDNPGASTVREAESSE